MADVETSNISYAQKSINEGSLLIPSMVSQSTEFPQDAPRPSGPEVAEVARKLGIDLVFDSDLLYIAEDLLLSPLPEDWEVHQDESTGKPYYHNSATQVTQWAHPLEQYYRGLVFMRKEGDQLLEDKAHANPPNPEETREMAKYFNIEPREEVYLMPIAKAAVNAPLPPEWEEYEDDDGEVYFVSKITKKTSEHHPLDGYFIELINQKRRELHGMQAPVYPLSEYHLLDHSFVPYPWMEYLDVKTARPFWYNFKDNLTSFNHPCDLVKDVMRTQATLRIQAWHRGFVVRKANRELVEHLAACSIQKIWRGHHTRGDFDMLKLRREAEAATAIQAIWRGAKQREKDEAEKEHAAAILIQSKWRGTIMRRNRPVVVHKAEALPFGVQHQAVQANRENQVSETMIPEDIMRDMDMMSERLETSEGKLENLDRMKILQRENFMDPVEDAPTPSTPVRKKGKGKKGKAK